MPSPSKGTLKSTRMRTFLPLSSTSVMDSFDESDTAARDRVRISDGTERTSGGAIPERGGQGAALSCAGRGGKTDYWSVGWCGGFVFGTAKGATGDGTLLMRCGWMDAVGSRAELLLRW